MAKFRKKPVAIEAFQYDGDLIDRNGNPYVPEWAMDAFKAGVLFYNSLDADGVPCELFIKTLEGTHHASVGDYIIRGIQGEIYPCKPNIFEATYERVDAE